MPNVVTPWTNIFSNDLKMVVEYESINFFAPVVTLGAIVWFGAIKFFCYYNSIWWTGENLLIYYENIGFYLLNFKKSQSQPQSIP